MKKLMVTLVAGLFMASLVSCASVEQKKKDCNGKCAADKKVCLDKATDAKTKKVDKTKAAACEKDAKACGDKCAAIK
jgi:hypothetical protein